MGMKTGISLAGGCQADAEGKIDKLAESPAKEGELRREKQLAALLHNQPQNWSGRF